MAGAVELTLADLDGQFGASYVAQVFCDDGSGLAGPRVDVALSVARRVTDAILLTAWTAEQISTLVVEDDAVRSSVLDLAMAEGMKGRPQWDGGPDSPRQALRKGALDTLRLLAKGEERSAGEALAGRNPHTQAGRVRTERTPHTFLFASTKGSPRRGGF